MAGNRGGRGDRGNNGLETLVLVAAGMLIGILIGKTQTQNVAAQQPAEYRVETWVGPPNNTGPAQFITGRCFTNAIYLPNGALIFDNYGNEIDQIPVGITLEPGTCI